jgi:hypothetical protein
METAQRRGVEQPAGDCREQAVMPVDLIQLLNRSASGAHLHRRSAGYLYPLAKRAGQGSYRVPSGNDHGGDQIEAADIRARDPSMKPPAIGTARRCSTNAVSARIVCTGDSRVQAAMAGTSSGPCSRRTASVH